MQPYMSGIQILGTYLLNISILKVVPYSAALMADQIFILLVTYNLFLWIVGHHHSPSAGAQPAPGFKTSNV
jgi:hypothetical protein